MQPPDTEAREEAAWAAFLRDLSAQLAAQWPAMQERLGDRTEAFVTLAAQQAAKRGLTQAAAVARYASLWFVWGPSFHDKPGFEWAQGLLAAPAAAQWGTVHRLVRRSLAELARLPEARIEPATLAAVDERLLSRYAHLGHQGALHPPEPPPAPRLACDLEAFELRLVQPAVDERYELQGAQWQRLPMPVPPPLRVDAATPLPRLVGVLSHAGGQGRPAKLQLRARTHAVCDATLHPELRYGGSHGQWRWQGHETRSVSWPLAALQQPGPAAGPGTAVAEETSPEICKLELEVCGLRDEGDALGTQSTQVWIWPASQWWVELQRQAAAAQPVVAGRDPVLRATTRCRVERDGQPEDAAPLRRGFEQGLEAATAAALQALLAAWTAVPGLSAPRLEGVLALLVGRAALAWGWQLGAGGLDGRALMRVLGDLDLQACQSDLHFEGELALGGARARVALHCAGAAALALQIRREAAEPPLLPTLLPALARFKLPFTAEVTPLATDTGALLQAAAPCTGALAGEAGLRPRSSGGSGWEWYAALRLEEASLALSLVDPVLGVQRLPHALWPAQPLCEWRLG